jgi:hypothetical protein
MTGRASAIGLIATAGLRCRAARHHAGEAGKCKRLCEQQEKTPARPAPHIVIRCRWRPNRLDHRPPHRPAGKGKKMGQPQTYKAHGSYEDNRIKRRRDLENKAGKAKRGAHCRSQK